MSADPRWFWKATFIGGGSATFYADSKALAWDHAHYALARDFHKAGVKSVTRLKHSTDVSAAENAAAGRLHQP